MVSREKNTQIGQDNVGARERGGLTARELTRVVETFNKVLEYKERIRESLEEELGLLAKQTKENLERLKILGRNLEIYEQNMDKIASNLDALDHQEIQVKEKYENLLHGAGSGEGEGGPWLP
ncbi:MAG: hypothetical protein GWM98_07465 [Nitrospinaceae bacterium]|nr:hypothetical protein [Nitrospinaceae bacterium]NIR54371.1 hypothetical protein [Nitrospinaceae bacterium]NIS85956.1 hypothetical protein [Nitrospinaceae bacterium]NIT81590.1 hypothetical protein [Nitrospinaceae bacterium]NIU43874.1 hypothetical protein [Nitrospinaceae bacterium]